VNREQLLSKLERAWRDFVASYAGLSEELLLEPGVTGRWSVRDIVAHVTTWEEEALKHLPTIRKGGTPLRYSIGYGGIDAFNAQTTEKKKDLSLADVFRERDNVHQRLLAFLQQVPDQEFRSETRFCRRLRLDTYGHYPKHSQAVRKWRERRIGIFNSSGRVAVREKAQGRLW
jgi:hypothetical protein